MITGVTVDVTGGTTAGLNYRATGASSETVQKRTGPVSKPG
jgi:hypothetical protein